MIEKISRLITNLLTGFSTNHKKARFFQVVVFVFILLPVMFLAIFSYINIYQNSTEAVLLRRAELAIFASTLLKERFDYLTDLGISLATRVNFRKLISEGKWEEAIKILDSIPKDFSYIERVFITDPEGTLLADTPALPDAGGQNFSYRDWYKGIINTNAPYISEVYKRAAKPQYNVIAVAVPIKSENQEKLGILIMQIKLEALLDWSKNISIGHSGFIYFTDHKGSIAAHPKFPPQEEIVDFSSDPAIQKALRGEQGVEILFSPIEKEERVVAFASVPKYKWAVVVQEPTNTAFMLRRNGLRFILIVYGFIILFSGFLAYLIMRAIYTINNYRQKEKIFLDCVGDGLLAIDRNWNITLFNKAAGLISGWSQGEVIGKPLRAFVKFIRVHDRKENITFIENAIVTGKTRQMENDTVLITKDGREVPVGDSASPIFEKGRVIGAIIIFRDIAKEKESQMLRSDFAYASHQLRTPVTKALWSVEAVKKSKSLKQIKKECEVAYNFLQSVSKLVEQLIIVSEIDQGLVIPKKQTVKIADLFNKEFKILNEKAKKRYIQLVMPAISAVAAITTDPKLFKKALYEIADNAINYSGDKSEVKIKIAFEEKNLLIEIKDSGIGIPQEQQASVFTKFFRGNNVPPKSVGAGLGLYIAREYIKLLKRKVWFKSEKGKGTNFFILLPLVNH